ncbi:MAG: hypothetical protein K2X77_28215 [Candidatus Obscuribacterales bacterium]|jgi:hypothetical protein|nr:hypothetical protein [Candidatus Obscuribacterales bacterium]
MRLKSMFTAAVVAGAFGVTVTAALAGPLMLGPTTAPMVPKIMSVPIVKVSMVQTKLLNTYREVRAFWLSRALVR